MPCKVYAVLGPFWHLIWIKTSNHVQGKTMEEKLKHLEFIQNVIARMNSNSFLLKGWCITLVAALIALSAKDSDKTYLLIGFLPLPAFWVLDAFYISKERQYRQLYKKVSSYSPNQIDFSMSTKDFGKGINSWLGCILSKTLWPFYGTITLTLAVVIYLMGKING